SRDQCRSVGTALLLGVYPVLAIVAERLLARPPLFRLHRRRECIGEARRALLARGRDAQRDAVHLAGTVLAHAGAEVTAPAMRHRAGSCPAASRAPLLVVGRVLILVQVVEVLALWLLGLELLGRHVVVRLMIFFSVGISMSFLRVISVG